MRFPILIAAALPVLVAMSAATPAFAGYGTIAYDQATGVFGIAWNKETQKAADESAMHDCSKDSCKIVLRINRGLCGALASSDDHKAWATRANPSRDTARREATENCQKRSGGTCVVRAAECNSK